MSRHTNHLFGIYHCIVIVLMPLFLGAICYVNHRRHCCVYTDVPQADDLLLLMLIFYSSSSSSVLSPPEKTWSYKCMNHRCVRQHYINKEEKRTTFMTCSMLCGSQILWPEPTVKSLIGTNANSFRLTDVQYKVQTPFKNVESLMESAFSIFLEEIKQIRHASGGTASEDTTPRSSTRSYRDVTYSSNGARIDTVSHPRRNLTTVNIYVNVIKTADVHLSMHTDECYNMTMSSKKRREWSQDAPR